MRNLRVKLAFSEYWLLSVYGMQFWNSDWVNIILAVILKELLSHITYYSLMFSIAYAFKGQVHVFAGRAKIVSHSSCRTSAILKYFCPLFGFSKEPSQWTNSFEYPQHIFQFRNKKINFWLHKIFFVAEGLSFCSLFILMQKCVCASAHPLFRSLHPLDKRRPVGVQTHFGTLARDWQK